MIYIHAVWPRGLLCMGAPALLLATWWSTLLLAIDCDAVYRSMWLGCVWKCPLRGAWFCAQRRLPTSLRPEHSLGHLLQGPFVLRLVATNHSAAQRQATLARSCVATAHQDMAVWLTRLGHVFIRWQAGCSLYGDDDACVANALQAMQVVVRQSAL